MTVVNKYRLWCNQEASYVYIWAESEPSTCPNDPVGHAIDTDQTTIVETAGQEARITDKQALLTASTYSAYDEDGQFYGGRVDCPAGSTAILDIPITTELFVSYGMCWFKNANDGDICEIELVDKNDVLGLFTMYGLEPGVDVLSLGKLAENIPMYPGDTPWTTFDTGDTAPVMGGLFIRAKYENNSEDQDAIMSMVFSWFRS
jgi:hypothetical protein